MEALLFRDLATARKSVSTGTPLNTFNQQEDFQGQQCRRLAILQGRRKVFGQGSPARADILAAACLPWCPSPPESTLIVTDRFPLQSDTASPHSRLVGGTREGRLGASPAIGGGSPPHVALRGAGACDIQQLWRGAGYFEQVRFAQETQ